MYTIRKDLRFEAAHQLAALPMGHKCRRVHGHNYVVTVELSRHYTNEFGFVVDFGDVKHDLGQWLKDHWDHRNLDATEGEDAVPGGHTPELTTAEHMARYLAMVCERWPWYDYLTAVTVYETPDSSATFHVKHE